MARGRGRLEQSRGANMHENEPPMRLGNAALRQNFIGEVARVRMPMFDKVGGIALATGAERTVANREQPLGQTIDIMSWWW